VNSWVLAGILFAIMFAAAALGLAVGKRLRTREGSREPLAAMQTALIGIVGLILAFGLALAVGRYEARRVAVVEEANAIRTTYLRAQTLATPLRSASLDLVRQYTDASIRLADAVPGSDEAASAIAEGQRLQLALWSIAGRALYNAPRDSAPRLYVETLNEMIDARTVRIAGLTNRVPTAVLAVALFGAALAVAALGMHLSILGRGLPAALVAAGLITMVLLVTFDLDRPTRGLIKVPDTALTDLRSMEDLPPAVTAPNGNG
jgi:hypothetical protein